MPNHAVESEYASLEESRNKPKKIDAFFDNIGYCKYHYFCLFVFIFVFFADGTEILVISLILRSLENEWKISALQKSLLASSAFIGLIIGSFLTAKYIDIYGRKVFLLLGGIIVIFFGFLCCLASNAYELFFLRVLAGIGIGAQVPAATNLAAESIPSYNRSVYLANLWIAFPMGELYVCIVGIYVMPNFEEDQWRTLLLYCLFPVFICTVCSFFVMESGRFLLSNQRYDEAKDFFINLSEYAKVPISQEQLEEIEKESKENPLNKYESSFVLLLSDKFYTLSTLTWVIWFVGALVLYGTIYMLPQILSFYNPTNIVKGGKMFKDVIISNLISLPKSLISGFIPNFPFLGRKFSMCYFFFFIAFLEVLLIFDAANCPFYSGFIKLSTGVILGIVKIYTTEAYPTKIRGLGYGTGHSICRIAGCLVPFVCEIFRFLLGILGPSFLFLGLSIFSAYCCYKLPFETLGRQLDEVDDNDVSHAIEIGSKTNPENNQQDIIKKKSNKSLNNKLLVDKETVTSIELKDVDKGTRITKN